MSKFDRGLDVLILFTKFNFAKVKDTCALCTYCVNTCTVVIRNKTRQIGKAKRVSVGCVFSRTWQLLRS